MSEEVLVKVEGVSKKFCRSLKKSLWYGVCDIAGELLPFGNRKSEVGDRISEVRYRESDIENQTPESGVNSSVVRRPSSESSLRDGEFYAVKDVSFELRRGECLGLIGHNGAGKTTLLKMLNGLIKPDNGTITMRGRIGALIALGAGFNPILTGRENIYVNGSVLGLTKREIDEKMEEIIDFSEIREFIDSPVQSYSSGMQVRLGFAVATAMNPDVLILDEVLAVGDAAFRFKCYKRIDEILENTAMIFVSHNMPDVMRICTDVMLLDRGQIAQNGKKEEGVKAYEKYSLEFNTMAPGFISTKHPVVHFDVFAPKNAKFNEPFEFNIDVESVKDVPNPTMIVNFFNSSQQYACNALIEGKQYGMDLLEGKHKWSCRIASLPLRPGDYKVAVHLLNKRAFIASHSRKLSVNVEGGFIGSNADCIITMDEWKNSL